MNMLKTHVVKILSLFWMVNFLPFHTCLRNAIIPVAFPARLLISSEQLLSQVIRLPSYSNLSTFSTFFFRSVFFVLFFCHRAPWFWFFLRSPSVPACAAAALVFSICSCRDLKSSSIRSMSSANLRLFTRVPPSFIR